jgi:fatty-acyl-CoA synthase
MSSGYRESFAGIDSYQDLKVLADITRFHSLTAPTNTALVYEGRRTSFAELDQYASQVANGLAAEGIQRQSNVAWLDINTDYFFETLFGCAKSNSVICPVNWRLAAPEILYILNDAEAQILFVGERFVDLIENIADQLVTVKKIIAVSGGHPEWEDYVSWRDKQSGEDPALDASPTDVAIQMYTSGTTGHPKGVLLSSGALLAPNADNSDEMEFNRWTSEDVSLLVMPCFHIAGLRWGVMGLLPGAETVIMPEFDPVQVAQLISAHQVTKLMLVPAALQFVIQATRGTDPDFSSLRHIWYGASPIPLDLLKEAMNVFQCDFAQTYGLTETAAQTTYLPPGDHDVKGNERMKSAGKALPNIKIRIVDEHGLSLPTREIGEICVNSPANMIGYWKSPEATAKTIVDGWVHTGDVGYMDEDGYVYIHDRIKDMVVSGGENVYPAEVESAIYGHPAVADVAVIGVPDKKWGEAVKAIVVVQPGQSCTADELIAYARERIAAYKAPKSVDFVDVLPRNPSGKILKKDLRAKYWKGTERMVQ